MASAGRKILYAIAELRGADIARCVGEACAGRCVRFGATALARDTHPFRQALGAKVAQELVALLRAKDLPLRATIFPSCSETEHQRLQRERAALIRRLLLSGASTSDIVREAKISSRAVHAHRAKLRAEKPASISTIDIKAFGPGKQHSPDAGETNDRSPTMRSPSTRSET
ncbi:hypothetical protein [Methylobacterium platani]|uniref:hypothetical protein n=1 Tax=Methylobacterium platani TaxID=427683 RepID=UPI000A6BBEFD|nr:hypothetical protein [Methylobacterium platani]